MCSRVHMHVEAAGQQRCLLYSFYNLLFFFLTFITSVYGVSVWNVCCMCAGACEDQGTYPGTGVLGGCEPPDISAGN